MISCDKGNTTVVGRGYEVLAEWDTLTYAILSEFSKQCASKGLQEELKKKMCESLEKEFELAFNGKTDEETLKGALESLKETVLKALAESWKS